MQNWEDFKRSPAYEHWKAAALPESRPSEFSYSSEINLTRYGYGYGMDPKRLAYLTRLAQKYAHLGLGQASRPSLTPKTYTLEEILAEL